MEIELRALTPIWTGGADGKCDRLHETGIIGSLRWWYEALVRGLGGWACDPASEGPRCGLDQDAYRRSKANDEPHRLRDARLCDACQVFGASGWRRRFRVEIDDRTMPCWSSSIPLNIRPPNRNRGWYPVPGRFGDLTLRFHGDESTLNQLAGLFLFLEKWGCLGAKPQLGYGVFETINRDELVNRKTGFQFPFGSSEEAGKGLPDLREFIFFRYTFQPRSAAWWGRAPGIAAALSDHKNVSILNRLHAMQMVPITPDFRNKWRFENGRFGRSISRWVFGISTLDRKTQQFDRVRSKYAVSWAYLKDNHWHIRGWLWLPSRDDHKALPAKEHEYAKSVILDKNTFDRLVGVTGVLTTRSGLEALHDS